MIGSAILEFVSLTIICFHFQEEALKVCPMQPFKDRQKHFLCHHCPKSFKSANGLKYHLGKVYHDEENKMVIGKEGLFNYAILTANII